MSNSDVAYKLAEKMEAAAIGLCVGITQEKEGFSIWQAPIASAMLETAERLRGLSEFYRKLGN